MRNRHIPPVHSNTYRRWDINPVRCRESYCGEQDQEKPSISTNIALDLFIKGFPILKYLWVIAKSVLLHDTVEKCTNTLTFILTTEEQYTTYVSKNCI